MPDTPYDKSLVDIRNTQLVGPNLVPDKCDESERRVTQAHSRHAHDE